MRLHGLCYKIIFSQTRQCERVVVVVVVVVANPIISNMFDCLDGARLNS